MAGSLQRITANLWFDDKAEEAADFYVSIFPHSRVTSVVRYGAEGARASGRPAGSVMTVAFELDGQRFVALNGGPVFTFSPAISLIVNCETQEEVDWYWDKLTAGGQAGQCGWLADRYGLSWQVVPVALQKMLAGKDTVKTEQMMAALIKMKKLDIGELERAFAGRKG
jgi:predicted 3-demethylubiquinone-9 3-methyltransferase (glyoxalase superfamily)